MFFKVAYSIPYEVTGIIRWIDLSGHTVTPGRLSL
jgi:hypothetical protein